MAITITATPGSATANSYVTVENAEAYFATYINPTAWERAGADAKAKALITAALRLDEESYLGTRATDTQALAWPRSDVERENGTPYQETEIPIEIVRAQLKLALWILAQSTGGVDPFFDDLSPVETDVAVGPIRIAFAPSVRNVGALPVDVRRALGRLVTSGGGAFAVLRG